ncbi:hypothetical protein VTN77DRAFT_2055 [Rasamsonia byssochlamydoides]|uniref:uncharacterized protein n=1 Tax=Rasamsonia byssochlamydoides TaxID=89139 RepID=UPI0037433B0D
MHSSVGGPEGRRDETWLAKYLAGAGLMLPACLSSALLVMNHKNWTRPVSYIEDHRSLVGILVQVISHLLGMVYTYALCTTINLSARASFTRHPVSLDSIKLINALCGQRPDLSLPWRGRLTALAFYALTLFPAALWAGAITPVPASQTTTEIIQLPAYNKTSWLGLGPGGTPATKNEAQGIFTFNPAWDLQGLILNSATSASNRTGGPVIRPKLDKTQYSYVNRSYGVGAAVGLTDGLINQATSYVYYENGFESSISCIYNRSSAYHLIPSSGQPSNWFLHVYEAKGTLPNTPPNAQPQDSVAASIGANPAIVAIATDTSNGQNYIALITDAEQYDPLNYTQCQITFTQRRFLVNVDVKDRIISVAPQDETTWLNETVADLLNQQIIQTLNNIASSLSTSLYVNPLGSALMDNIQNVQAVQGVSNASVFAGIEAVLTSMMDDAMVAFASAQIMLMQDTTPATVLVNSPAYAFGTFRSILAVVVITVLVAFVYGSQWGRTRGWRRLSKFDFMDVKSVIVAASEGGTAIAKEAQALHRSQGTRWYAAADDELVGGICVRLGKSAEGSIAVLLSERPRRRVYTGLVDESADGSMVLLREMAQPMGESEAK